MVKEPGTGLPAQSSSVQETRLTAQPPVGLGLTNHVREAGKRSGAQRDGQGERATPTLAQEEPRTGHVKKTGFPVLLSQLGHSRSGPAISGFRAFESSSNVKTGRAPGSPCPIFPLYKCGSESSERGKASCGHWTSQKQIQL